MKKIKVLPYATNSLESVSFKKSILVLRKKQNKTKLGQNSEVLAQMDKQ